MHNMAQLGRRAQFPLSVTLHHQASGQLSSFEYRLCASNDCRKHAPADNHVHRSATLQGGIPCELQDGVRTASAIYWD
jgi:hypothetical protein